MTVHSGGDEAARERETERRDQRDDGGTDTEVSLRVPQSFSDFFFWWCVLSDCLDLTAAVTFLPAKICQSDLAFKYDGKCYTCYLGFGRRKHIKIEFLKCLCHKGMICIFQYMIYTSFVSEMRMSILKTTRRTTLIADYIIN
ncbi:hypothetical protein HanLR1_Chr04g0153281 [Helianthus annuus]|nr:hypothetical protein HanLR1_Chr04g0153281 [Helianthus annuus]